MCNTSPTWVYTNTRTYASHHPPPTYIHPYPSLASAPSSAPQTRPAPKTAPSVTSPPTPVSSTTPSASASRSTSPHTRPGSLSTQNTHLRTSSPRSTSNSLPPPTAALSTQKRHRHLPPQHGSRPPLKPTSTSIVALSLRLLGRVANPLILLLSQR